MKPRLIISVFVITFILFAFTSFTGGSAMALEIKSSAFSNGNPIPPTFTCDGENTSPPLVWTGAPAGTKSFALISDDPDAPRGTWVHWVVWNIPASVTSLPEGVKPAAKQADGTMQGIGDSRKPGWDGPCPPSGTHRYFFKLYALDALISIPATSGKAEIEAAMKGHILAEAKVMGTYSRQR